jgi:hypothetical protein
LKLAFIILAHRDPDNVARLAERVGATGATVAVHYDRKASGADFAALHSRLAGSPNIVFAERVDVTWGQWSIVRATLNAIAALEATKIDFDYVHLMSGMDYPIRPIEWFDAFLTRYAGTEFVEAVNIRERSWVRGGLEHERYQYLHVHNWQIEREKFERHWKRQRKGKQHRGFLDGLDPYLGAQWWTLTWASCLGALRWSEDAAVVRYFQAVWIPDEMFFQTYVGNHVAPDRIAELTLTLYQFDPEGFPIVYYNDHADYITHTNFFFARKIAPDARALRDAVDLHVAELRKSPPRLSDRLGELPTEATEIIERHRFGLPNRRKVGFAVDPWYGDFEWNQDNYVVILSASRAAAERVRQILAAADFTICHGELFARGRIEFADGRTRFAGYRNDDMALRDNKRQSFLVDVIKAGAPAMTCFILLLEGDSQPQESRLQDILGWDRRAHLVLVQDNVIGAYFDWRHRRHQARTSRGADEPRLFTEAAEFAQFARSWRQPEIRKSLNEASKAAYFISDFDGPWQRGLRQFAIDAFNTDINHGVVLPRTFTKAVGARDAREPDDLPRVLRLMGLVADADEQALIASAYFAPVGHDAAPYFAIFAPSEIEASILDVLPRLMPGVEWLTVTYAPAAGAYIVASGRYRVAGIEAALLAPLLTMIVSDPRSSIVILRGETGAAAASVTHPAANGRASSGGIAHPAAAMDSLEHDLRERALAVYKAQLAESKLPEAKLKPTPQLPEPKAVAQIDLGSSAWFGQFLAVLRDFAARQARAEPALDMAVEIMREALSARGDGVAAHLRWRLEPYLVVLASSAAAGERVRAALNELNFVICHGELFAPDRIAVAEGRRRFDGLAAMELAARDRDPLKFLSRIVEAGAPSLTGFVFAPADGLELAAELVADPLARIVVVPAAGADPGLSPAMLQMLRRAGRRALFVDEADRNWQAELARLAGEAMAASGLTRP